MVRPAEQMVPCRVCGSSSKEFICKTFNEHSGSKWLSNYRCLDCGSVFIGDPVTVEELGEAYGTLDEDRYYSEIHESNEVKNETAATRMSTLVQKDAAVLDLGAGRGQFLAALRRHGFTRLSAHEIPGHSEELKRNADTVYEDFDYSSLPDSTFDCVTMLDVMEHVPSPRYTIEQVYRILKPQGLIYFHTPTVTKLDRAMHRTRTLPGLSKVGQTWQRGRTSIFHLQNYSAKGLRDILEGSGFHVEDLALRNELSWPVRRYVDVYLIRKAGLPAWSGGVLAPLLSPVLATSYVNADKAVVVARRR